MLFEHAKIDADELSKSAPHATCIQDDRVAGAEHCLEAPSAFSHAAAPALAVPAASVQLAAKASQK